MGFEPTHKEVTEPDKYGNVYPKTWRDYEGLYPELAEEFIRKQEKLRQERNMINDQLSATLEKAGERKYDV